MLTPADKRFLTEKFATHADLKAVKNDLKLLATKKELAAVKIDVADLKVDSLLLQKSMMSLERKVDKSVDLSQKALKILEGFAGKVADLNQENKMGSITLRRHGIQIHELATATSTKISE